MSKKSDTKTSSKKLPNYLYNNASSKLVDSFIEKTEEYIIDGEKGIIIKYYHVDKTKLKKVMIKSLSKDTFIYKIKQGKNKSDIKEDVKNVTKDELLKIVKSDKDLDFASSFFKTAKGGAWLDGALSRKKPSKKRSKKTSKKKSKSS